jgi:hypothetical protein
MDTQLEEVKMAVWAKAKNLKSRAEKSPQKPKSTPCLLRPWNTPESTYNTSAELTVAEIQETSCF